VAQYDTNILLPRILVVEDSESERSSLVSMLNTWGYSVDFVAEGQSALDLIKHERIQMVLANWEIPGMQGTAFCRELRQLDLGQYIYIILISSQNDDSFLIKALAAGADDVLSKPLDGNELEARLQSAVRRIELQGQLTGKTHELARAHDVIAQDLRAVSRLQRSFLPEPESPYPGLNYRWLSVPSKYVSGDHLQVFSLQHDVCGFYLLDVSGHGIPAAVKSMQLVQMLADQSNSSILFEGGVGFHGQRRVSRPRDVVARLNRVFQQTESDLSYFTMIYGLFNTHTRHLVFCQAGHPSPLLLSAGGQVQVLGGGGYPVGLFDLDDFQEIELILSEDQALILYSDGVTEVLSPQFEVFGEDRLLAFIKQQSIVGSWSDLPERIQMQVKRWGSAAIQQKGFEDDLSILMLAPQPGLLDQKEQITQCAQSAELDFHLQEPPDSPIQKVFNEQAKSIVIVDDSRSFLRIFEAILQGWGYIVYPAKNGHEALALIKQFHPDFLLTDWDMPGMSGIELCEHVRAQKRSDYTYIIMITGYASRDDLLRSLRVGADEFMTKPVNSAELKVRLKTAERIANLHKGLENRHSELSQLYEALQRDMREVSRIQRALLPKTRQEPWPFGVQTLYQPKGYVCGQQMGVLETQSNEHGFFMLSMPGEDTATALQTMALARWFSMARATRLLFPIEETSAKIRRYLSIPEQVLSQLYRNTASLNDDPIRFNLLYGLINLDQGSLLVAGIGSWCMVIVQPGCEPVYLSSQSNSKEGLQDGRLTYQGVITPGTRLYLYPQECASALGVANFSEWQEAILCLSKQGNLLNKEFSKLLERSRTQSDSLVDMSLMGIQWRESFDPSKLSLSESYIELLAQEFTSLGLKLNDDFGDYDKPFKAGEYLDCLAYLTVADTVNISAVSLFVRRFVDELAYSEDICYNTDLVVSEALTNVMIHGFKQIKPQPVQLVILAFQRGVGVLIEDKGNRIPAEVLNNMRYPYSFEDDLSLSDLPEGGMGLAFMRMVSRRFIYRPDAIGNRLLLLL
jgi:sigma-B regulation protein RsbU (phosphoserine phosphatase)